MDSVEIAHISEVTQSTYLANCVNRGKKLAAKRGEKTFVLQPKSHEK